MRLIDADVLTDSLDSLCDTVCQYSKAQRSVMCGACPLGGAFDVVENAPTVDAVERKRGEWKEITDRTMDCCYRCSKCGFIRDAYFLEAANFCPKCGTRMERSE